jgi:PAS domain S-box-containing protein
VSKRISLERSITLSILVIGLLSGTVGLAFAYWHAKQSLRTTLGLNFQELARHSADKVGLMLSKEVEWVERLSALPEVREAVEEGGRLAFDQPKLQQWREEQRQYFRSLVIVDRQGGLVGGVTSETTRAHYLQQPWRAVVMQQKHPWASDLHVDDAGHGYWEVATPITSDDGTVLGALKVVIGIGELFAPVLRTSIGQTGHAMLVADDGRVVICPIMPPGLHSTVAVLEKHKNRADGLRLMPFWKEVQNDSHGWQGGIVGVAPVVLPETMTQERIWHILVRQDPAETYAPLVSLMWKLAWFWIGAVGLVALVGSRLAHRIAHPLEGLVQRIRSFGEGQTSMRGQIPESFLGIAEIETLEASFNKLAEQLQVASQQTKRNMNELERANREIAKSEEHYRALWNHGVDSKLILDVGGIVRGVNRRTEIKLGRLADTIIGIDAAGLFVDADQSRFRNLLQLALETGKEGAVIDMRVPTAGGSTLTMELDIVPVEEAGSVMGVLLQLTDVTDKRQLERQLLRSERLASLSQFASMFAHDIRNPLAGIKKTLELLGHRPELHTEPIAQWFGDLQFTTDLLLGMINDMLDVYQESYSGMPLVSSAFSAGVLLQEAAHLFRSEAEAKNVTFQLAMPDKNLTMTADRRRLQRVSINLVHNALKYSPAGGVITLSARRAGQEALPADVSLPDQAVLLICVEDEGPGMEPDELPHIFEMFFRKKDGHDLRIGRGLGLHFCRLVVEAHGGRIWAENRSTGGARFSVAVPLRAEVACRSSL